VVPPQPPCSFCTTSARSSPPFEKTRESTSEFECFQEAADRDACARIGAVLMAVDGWLFGLDLRVERKADRHTVSEHMAAGGDPDIEVAIDISEAAGDVVDSAAGVRDLALEIGKRTDVRVGACLGLRAQRVGQEMATDMQISVLRIGAIGVGDEMFAQRNIDRQVGRALVRG
jgi:hypothetical protein